MILVGALVAMFYLFDFVRMGIIIPTDELTFFRGVAQPPTNKNFIDVNEYPLKDVINHTSMNLDIVSRWW